MAAVHSQALAQHLAPLPVDPRATLPQCQTDLAPVAGSKFLPGVRRALARGELRILAIGSSSTSGVGASSAATTYPARLRARLQRVYPNFAIRVINRGIPGENVVGAAARMKQEAAKAKPDLVLWQTGTNGAIAGVDLARFEAIVRRTIGWLRSEGIGLVLIDPQFVNIYKDHDHYGRVVNMLWRVARSEDVMLIRRYATMQAIARRRQLSAYLADDKFHLNDLGYRCLANYAATAIIEAGERGKPALACVGDIKGCSIETVGPEPAAILPQR